MPEFNPVARLTSCRGGHSSSTGATARNKGPGKSPFAPMFACATASSAATSARRSERMVDEKGSIGKKSTVPAIVVFRPSVEKRVIVRMPDSPADSFAQLSALPAPNEVTTPMPVTTTMGRPNLSRFAVMVSPQLYSLDQRHAFAAPVASPDHHNLGRRLGHFNLYAAAIVRGK